MRVFEEIGKRVCRLWAQRDRDDERFAEVAERLLLELPAADAGSPSMAPRFLPASTDSGIVRSVRARVLRDRDGSERVLIDIEEFQALLDAARRPEAGLPEVSSLIHRLAALLDEPREYVPLDEFLAEYDATHGESS